MPRIDSSCAAFCLAAWLVLLSAVGSAQERRQIVPDNEASGGAPMQFQIPSQALQQALDAFVSATGFPACTMPVSLAAVNRGRYKGASVRRPPCG